MSSPEEEPLISCELHAAARIQAVLEGGLDVRAKEWPIYDNIRLLLEASGRAAPTLKNIPNRYLTRGDDS